MIPAFDPGTGALPPGDHRATLEEIGGRFGFTPRRRWLLKGLRAAVSAFWTAGIEDIFIDGSFCTEKPDPGDVDGYWVEPDDGVYDRIDPYWIDFEMILVPQVRKWKWRMSADHGVEFFTHPAMRAKPAVGFPEFFRQDREGLPRGVIQIRSKCHDQERCTERPYGGSDRGLSASTHQSRSRDEWQTRHSGSRQLRRHD